MSALLLAGTLSHIHPGHEHERVYSKLSSYTRRHKKEACVFFLSLSMSIRPGLAFRPLSGRTFSVFKIKRQFGQDRHTDGHRTHTKPLVSPSVHVQCGDPSLPVLLLVLVLFLSSELAATVATLLDALVLGQLTHKISGRKRKELEQRRRQQQDKSKGCKV